MNKTIAVAACATTLAGCTTVADLREQPTFLAMKTDKTVSQVSACIGSQWERRSGAISTVPKEAGMSLSLNYTLYSNKITAAVVDITDAGPQRDVLVFARKGDANDKLRQEISGCV